MRLRLIAMSAGMVALLGSPVMAADLNPLVYAHDAPVTTLPPDSLPAVSGINGKLAGFASQLQFDDNDDEITAYGVAGALSIPIHHRYGAQFDVVFGSADEAAFYGGAAHLFWRDPTKGLIGVYGSYLAWDAEMSETFDLLPPEGKDVDFVDFDSRSIAGADVGKIGIEAEYYHNRMSLEGRLTYQFGDETGVAGDATLAFYPHDDLRLDIGYRYLEGLGGVGAFGAEWAPLGHMSAFVDAGFGEDDYARVTGGFTVYLNHGDDKPLIRRHREDDPGIDVQNDLMLTDSGCPEGTYAKGDLCVPF